VFVNQPAVLGLEILYRVLDGGKHLGVVQISEGACPDAALRIDYRALDPVKSEQPTLIELQIAGVGGGLLAAQRHFSLGDGGSSLDQVRARLGAGEFYHPFARTAHRADLRPERGTLSFDWALIAPRTRWHRQQVTGDERRVTRIEI